VAVFFLRQHDTAPAIQAVLSDERGRIDLTAATEVRFTMWTSAAIKVNRILATINDAKGALVSYSWASRDTDTAGSYNCEWEILWNNGTQQTVPSDMNDTVEILADGDQI